MLSNSVLGPRVYPKGIVYMNPVFANISEFDRNKFEMNCERMAHLVRTCQIEVCKLSNFFEVSRSIY